MLKYYISFILLFSLTSCFGNKENNPTIAKIETNSGTITCEECHKELWNMTGILVLPNKQAEFKKEISEIDADIKKNGKITFDNIINKGRNLEYIGDIGGTIKLYEENYSVKENKNSLVYNHNMAKLYETVQKNNLALLKYRLLIEKFKNYNYLRDISLLYENMGNKQKAKKFLDAYNKYTKTNSNSNSNSGISLDIN